MQKKTLNILLLSLMLGAVMSLLILGFWIADSDQVESWRLATGLSTNRALVQVQSGQIAASAITESHLDAALQAKINAGSGSNFHNLTAMSSIANEDELHFYNISSLDYFKITLANLAAGISGSGEANTASSAGSGTSVYYQKSGVDLQFNAIKSENDRLSVSLDGITHDVELTIHESNIDHDALSNYNALEHFIMANITTLGTVTTGDVSAIESDPGVTTHESTYNHSHYDTAYGWGDHAGVGYLNSTSLNTEAELENQLTDISNVYTNTDGNLNDDDVSLTDVQTATSSDFHNIGGTDDDVPDDDNDVPDSITVNPVNATTEGAIESVVDLQDLQGAVTDAQVPDNITITESDPNALLTAGTDNVKDTHIDWGTGVGQINLDDFNDQTPWRLFYSNGDGDVTELTLGSSGQYFKSNGPSAVPTWDTPAGGSGSSRWTAESTFVRSDDDTITITTDDCTNYPIGTPIRYSADESTWYYGIVTACTDNGSTIDVDLDGVPFTTARDDYLSYGIPEALRTVQLVGVGNASVSDTWFPKYLWGGPDAYLVRIYVYVDTAPAGSALEGNVECNGNNALDTEWSIAAAGSSTDSGITIDDTTYSNAQIEQDEFVEIDVSQVGSSTPGGNAAWALLYFVIP